MGINRPADSPPASTLDANSISKASWPETSINVGAERFKELDAAGEMMIEMITKLSSGKIIECDAVLLIRIGNTLKIDLSFVFKIEKIYSLVIGIHIIEL
ncbi:MAG: hypothetical protein LUQ10_03190 [Methanothrix sp.]|nr:hypothetical protein [Methanothrix sp.]